MKKNILKSQRALRRENERKMFKMMKNAIQIPTNNSFSEIKTELIEMGWTYIDQFINIVVVEGVIESTCSPAVKLVTERYNITLIPNREGVEISRLEVWEDYQGQGFASLFLDNLLRFLIKKGVQDIYVLPGQAGIGKSIDSLAYNDYALKSFYHRRGFRVDNSGLYWKLMSTDNIDVNRLDLETLSKDYPQFACA